MQHDIITKKLSWRLKELPAATGLSLPFWRKMVSLKKVRSRKIEGAVVILNTDLMEFLAGEPQIEEVDERETTNAN